MMIGRCTFIVLLVSQSSIRGHVWGDWKRLIEENSRENRKLTIETSASIV